MASAAAVEHVELLRPLKFEDLMALPDTGELQEIIQGELVLTPPPRLEHQDLSQVLSVAIDAVVRPRRLGKVFTAPIGVRLTLHDIVQPDLVYLSQAKRSLVNKGIIDGPPDFVAEILSPSTRRMDLVRKRALYRSAGIPEYWIIDPQQRTIAAFALVDGEYVSVPKTDGVIRSRVIPGLEINVAELFEDVWWSE